MHEFVMVARKMAYLLPPSVDDPTMRVACTGVTQAPIAKEQIAQTRGAVAQLIAYTGFYSEASVQAFEPAKIEPSIAVARDVHHPNWRERHRESAAPLRVPQSASTAHAMSRRFKTQAGRALYALRKQTAEPAFGIINSLLGFHQFSVRGLHEVRIDGILVWRAWSFKRNAALHPQFG